jgi:hypothetical protein
VIYSNREGKQAFVLEVVHEASFEYFILGVGGMVNKPRLHVRIYRGKPLVSLGFSRICKVAMFVVFNFSKKSENLTWCCPLCGEETIHNCLKHVIRNSMD